MCVLRNLRRILPFLVVFSIVLMGGGIVWALGRNQTLSFMLMGTFIIHIGSRPKPAEWVTTLLVAGALRMLYGRYSDIARYFASDLIFLGSFLGLASLLVLAIQTARSQGEVRKARWTTFLTAGALPYAWMVTAFCLASLAFTPRSNDALLLAFDTSLGASTSFILAKMLAGRPLLHDLTVTVYSALPLGSACILAWYNQSRSKPVKVIPMYITTMIFGFCLYWLYPAAGPAFAYPTTFPQSAPGKWEILTAALPPFVAPRNAMPSLHFAAMLLLMWNSRAWRLPARFLAACFTCGIAFSTLALGEHYLIDLVVAFPFMLAVQSLWSTAVPLRSPCRYQALVAGILATGAWLIALRWAIPLFLASATLGWGCVLLTIAGSIHLERRLARAVWRPSAGSPAKTTDTAVESVDAGTGLLTPTSVGSPVCIQFLPVD